MKRKGEEEREGGRVGVEIVELLLCVMCRVEADWRGGGIRRQGKAETPQGRFVSATCTGWSSLSQAFCYADLLSLLSKTLMESVCV